MKRVLLMGLVVAIVVGSATAVFAAKRRPPSKSHAVKVSRNVGAQRRQGASRVSAKSRPTASGSVRNDGSRATAGASSRNTTSDRAGSSQTGYRKVNDRSSDGTGVTVKRNGLTGASASVSGNFSSKALRKTIPKV